ncbi:MAG: Druantia anti-phage system protein DruA [Methylococcales bacterium]
MPNCATWSAPTTASSRCPASAPPLDRYIGWTPPQRRQYLHRAVNNARFLILPWIDCNNLASSILARAARRIADDRQLQYGYRPVLLESFVEPPRFRGTDCQAANWIHLGETAGRGTLNAF